MYVRPKTTLSALFHFLSRRPIFTSWRLSVFYDVINLITIDSQFRPTTDAAITEYSTVAA